MKALSVLLIVAALPAAVQGQNQAVQGPSPRDIVERLWIDATAGNLLTPAGLKRASSHYEFAPDYLAKRIRVVSNDWAFDSETIDGQKASVIIGFFELGTLDSRLRFRDTPDDPCGSKDFAVHKLDVKQTYIYDYGSDGKTLLAKKPVGFAWGLEQSQGYRWATVNATIRYVLEMRAKTADPEIKKNADKTIATLLRYH